jgi:hypothetical protein
MPESRPEAGVRRSADKIQGGILFRIRQKRSLISQEYLKRHLTGMLNSHGSEWHHIFIHEVDDIYLNTGGIQLDYTLRPERVLEKCPWDNNLQHVLILNTSHR